MRLVKRIERRTFKPNQLSQEQHSKESEIFDDRHDISLISTTEDQFRKSIHSNTSALTLGKSSMLGF